MGSDILYSAAHDDLFDPGKREGFFPFGRPNNDATLCAEMARLAYCREEPDFPFDRDRIAKILDRIEFASCQFFEEPGTPRGQGSHGFLAKDPAQKLAVVAFRGTDATDFSDLAFDADFIPKSWPKGGNVHEGFAKALAKLPGLQPVMDSLAGFRKLFTGHSLGAAMATLFASLHPPEALYTFGSPRVGDTDFIRSLQGIQGRRYVDCCDIVPRVPLELMNFAHLGKPHYIDRNRKVTFDPDDGTMRNDQLLAEIDYVRKYLRFGNVPIRNLADHAPINYIWPVTADGT
jgi:hypothetical protein